MYQFCTMQHEIGFMPNFIVDFYGLARVNWIVSCKAEYCQRLICFRQNLVPLLEVEINT